MAVDRSIKLTIDAAVTDAEYQRLITAIAAAARNAGTTTTTTAAYSAGVTDNVTIALA